MEHIKSQNEGMYTPEEIHEETDINVRAIVSFGVFLLILAAVIHVGLWFFYQALNHRYEKENAANTNPMLEQTIAQQGTSATRAPDLPAAVTAESTQEATKRLVATFPEPRLQPDEYRDYEVYKRRVDEQLNAYSWINKNDGSVRIPISRAMELIAERGLPAAGLSSPAPMAKQAPRKR
jgi:hypothetical protein